MIKNLQVAFVILFLVSFLACSGNPRSELSSTPASTPDTSDLPTNVAPSLTPSPKIRDGLGWMHLRDDYYEEDQWRWSFPNWAYEQIEGTETEKIYDRSNAVNPFLINGDFDGDGKFDVAVVDRIARTLSSSTQ